MKKMNIELIYPVLLPYKGISILNNILIKKKANLLIRIIPHAVLSLFIAAACADLNLFHRNYPEQNSALTNIKSIKNIQFLNACIFRVQTQDSNTFIACTYLG
jgi:hypothetical protein